MNNELFILSNNLMLISGVQKLAEHIWSESNVTLKIKRVTLMELMRVDASYKFNKKYSVAIVPDHIYEALHIFAGLENIKIVPSDLSLSTFSALLKDLSSYSVVKSDKKEKKIFLTAKERRYCYLVYKGVTNKKIASNFQCTEKNVSYLKKKIMMKWSCKNNVEFFKLINYFFCNDKDSDGPDGFF